MAVDALGARSSTSASFAAPSAFRDAVICAAADALDLRHQNITFAFANGMSIADLARMRGVPKRDVVAAVASGIRALEDASGGLPGAPDLLQMAVRIVDRSGGLSGDRHENGLGAALNRALGGAVDSAA